MVLGIQPGATENEIKSAYRKLAKQYHPDRNPGDEDAARKFREANEAYEQLTKPKAQGQNFNPFGNGGPFGGNPFGGGFSFRTVMRAQCEVSIKQAFDGCEVSAMFNMGGSVKTVLVKLPPGVRHGTMIEVEHDDPNVQLAVLVVVRNMPNLEVHGVDFVAKIDIDAIDAMLGGQAEFDSIDGKHFIDFPAGTTQGQGLKIAGAGMRHTNELDKRGDLYLFANLVVRAAATEAQREAALALKEALKEGL